MFCTIFTGLPPATGFAAPTPMHALGEKPRRAASRLRHGDHWSLCRKLLGGLAAAFLAERIA